MAKSRKVHRKTKSHRKAHRKTNRKSHRKQRGGEAPVNYQNPGPMGLSLAQGQQFAAYHAQQHGGMGAYAYGPYPGAVTTPSELPNDLIASAKLLPLNNAFNEIRGMKDQAGGKRKKGRKGSRKGRKTQRKAHRKQRGGLYRWGGGSRAEMNAPMEVADEGKMLIPANLQAQAGLNPEWGLIEKNPTAFNPRN